jgi:hypothetical protein
MGDNKIMKHNHFGTVILILAVLLSACGSKLKATPTTEPSVILTSVAQTAAVRLSAMPSNTPAPTETASPSETPTLPATATPFSSPITGTLPVALPTQATTAPISVGSGPDLVMMVSDLDVTDGTQFDPGAKFTKTWRLMNSGTSTWTTGYSLVHVSGNDIGGPSSVPLPSEVQPGKMVDVSVDLTAPTTDGTFTSYWKLKNTSGQLFGVGANGSGSFWVKIQVGGNANPAPTDTPNVTPGSATGTPSATVRHLRVDVDNSSVTDKCPHTFSFTATFRLSVAATVRFQWEASDSMYSVPASTKISMPAGLQTVPFSLNVTSANSGWLRFHITSPDDVTSEQVDFSVTCTP